MPSSPFPSSPDEPYKYDESFLQSQDEDRVQLPQETEEIFYEEQTFDQIWIWILLGIGVLAVFIPLLITGQAWWMFLFMGVVEVLSLSIISSFRLSTTIDASGVHYRVRPFHRKERIIPWSDIDQIYVRRYSALGEYGGWGMRYGLNGMMVNTDGNYGIQIIRKNGKKILIGTHKPDEASGQISHHFITV
jgi:hypothetical protein